MLLKIKTAQTRQIRFLVSSTPVAGRFVPKSFRDAFTSSRGATTTAWVLIDWARDVEYTQ